MDDRLKFGKKWDQTPIFYGVFIAGVVDKDYWDARMKETAPKVSIIMPCLNEERFIGRAIESLVGIEIASPQERLAMTNTVSDRGQAPKKNAARSHFLDWELIVVDGGSTDRTREIVRSYAEGEKADELGIRGRVRLLENPKKVQSYGMNMGIREAHGEIICRADAHCIYPPEYVRRCVELLEMTKAANAGGTRIPRPAGPGKVITAIALAVRHPMGVGDAKFQLGNYTGEAEGAYYGTFWKKLFDEIGFYDPAASPNEDGELNLRIRKAGKMIYLDSSIEVVYFPRESLSALARQYFSYGKGRCYTSIKHRKMTSWRQAAPVALVAGLAAALVLSIWMPAFLLAPGAYIASVLGCALFWSVRKDETGPKLSVRLLMAAAWMIMHTCWGLGFWKYLIFRK